MIKITEKLIRDISDKAKSSPRMRVNYNFHQSYDAVLQRMLNAAEPGTYIQPHKHEDPDKAEVFVILSGRVVVVEYDDKGRVVDHVILAAGGPAKAVEIEPRAWHSFIALEPGSVLYEAKEGPYRQITDKNFAAWAPEEGSPGAREFNEKVLETLGIHLL